MALSACLLGVKVNNRLTFDRYISEILAISCAQTLFALRMDSSKAIRTVFQAVVEAKLCYVGLAWYGYTAADHDQIRASRGERSDLDIGQATLPRSIMSSRLWTTVCLRVSMKIANCSTCYFYSLA